MIEEILLGAFLSGLVGVFIESYRRCMDEKREKRERKRNLFFSLAMLSFYLKSLEENYDIVSAYNNIENLSEIGRKNNIFLNRIIRAYELIDRDTLIRLLKIMHKIERLRLNIQFTTPSKRERYRGNVIQLLGNCNDVLRKLEEELKIEVKLSDFVVSVS